MSKSIIYKKIQHYISLSIVKRQSNTYQLNTDIWPELTTFFETLNIFEQTSDPRIPAASIIYHKTQREIIFSTITKIDAARTAFSAYEQYGLALLLPTTFYYLPKKHLAKKDVFLHSLYVIDKEKERRYALYGTLFYAKYRRELITVSHPLLEEIRQVLDGKNVKGFPTYDEVKEKAEAYDIRL